MLPRPRTRAHREAVIPSRLPEPSEDERRHSEALAAVIRGEIRRAGPVDFQRWMQLCLYAPGLGYYSAGRAKFGAAGDFVTAPELGPLFARSVAQAVAPVLRETGGELLELGAGSGALAADLLTELAEANALPVRYRILETSADLRARQQDRIARLPPALAERVSWLNAPPIDPWQGVLIANEVLDALPVQRFVLRGESVLRECVALDGDGRFVRAEAAAETALAEPVARLFGANRAAYPDGYTSEWLPQLEAWLRAVVERLARGLALFVDYGHACRDYYHPSRREGTLTCHYRQRVHDDALLWPGLQDLTAWVDFTRVSEALRTLGFDQQCYATQGTFLLAAGLPAIFQREAGTDPERTYRLAQEVKQLTLPAEMGERFKILAAARGVDAHALAWWGIDQGDRL
jgi:SAM-dependent MidA family methyltransferase